MESNPPVGVTVDPAECWAAVLGVRPILSKRVETISPAQMSAAARVPETVRKRARALVNDGIEPAPVPPVEYQRMLKDTSESWAADQVQVARMMEALPDNVELAYLHLAATEFALLQKALPKAGWKTYSGTENLEPDPMAMLQFSELLAAVEDPMGYVFGAIADGSITRDVAKVVRATFPTLAKCIDAEIHAATVEKVTKTSGYVLPWRAEIGMEAWTDQPLEPPAPAAPPAPAPASQKDDEKLDKEELTPSQRVEAGAK